METSAVSTTQPTKLLSVFFILFVVFVVFDRVVDRLGLLGAHQPFWRSAMIGALWAALMASIRPLFSDARSGR
jgi:hypothetical protein